MKLEVGMYCRHKNSIIGYKPILINKIIQIIDTDDLKTYHLNDGNVLFEKDIIKASYNIIDLIEVGDYVNSRLVTDIQIHCSDEIDEEDGSKCLFFKNEVYGIYNQDIETILTKEQFENNCFRIGDENRNR